MSERTRDTALAHTARPTRSTPRVAGTRAHGPKLTLSCVVDASLAAEVSDGPQPSQSDHASLRPAPWPDEACPPEAKLQELHVGHHRPSELLAHSPLPRASSWRYLDTNNRDRRTTYHTHNPRNKDKVPI